MDEAGSTTANRRIHKPAPVPAALVSLLLFAEILLYGANATDLALGFSGVWFVALALLLTQAWARSALDQVRVRWIGAAFAAVLLAGFLSLSPYAVGGPNPIWTWVPRALPATSIDPYATLVELIKLAGLAAAFLVGAIFGADDERAKSLIRWLLALGLAYSLWAFVDRVTNPVELFGAARAFDPSRLSASLVSANTAATFFGTLTLLNLVALDRALRNQRSGAKLDLRSLERLAPRIALPLIALVAAAACLILTLSRSGISATSAIGIMLVGTAAIARARRSAVSVPAVATLTVLAGVVLASFALNLASLQDRLRFLGQDAVTRSVIFAAHGAAFAAAPFSGYGLGSFARINAMITNQANLNALALIGAVHNVYLQWLEQAGLIGATPLVLCLALIGVKLARGVMRRRQMRSWLVAVLGVLTLFLIHGASDFALEVPAMAALLSLLLGVGCGAASQIGCYGTKMVWLKNSRAIRVPIEL